MSLQDLYQDIIIDHGKQPRNVGSLPEATHQQVGYNPLCGDKLEIYVKATAGQITDVRFQGEGCAISMASASLLSGAVKGKSIAEFQQLFTQFHAVLTTETHAEVDLGKLAALAGVAQYPMRVKCATLAWHTLKAALANEPNVIVSTE